MDEGEILFHSIGGAVDFRAQTANAIVDFEGSVFSLRVSAEQLVTMTPLIGNATMYNERGEVTLKAGEQGYVGKDAAPVKTAVINVLDVMSWVTD